VNRKGSTRIAGRDAQVMCEVIQIMDGRGEKGTRKYRNSLLYRVLLNGLDESVWQVPRQGWVKRIKDIR